MNEFNTEKESMDYMCPQMICQAWKLSSIFVNYKCQKLKRNTRIIETREKLLLQLKVVEVILLITAEVPLFMLF